MDTTETEHLQNLEKERIAKHEAAHGIVWYLFKNNWIIHKLTIESNGLPDERMKGALHLSPNFDTKQSINNKKINELFAIALAGMVGQNIEMVINNQFLIRELGKKDFNEIFDKNGCGGDFELANKYAHYLALLFQTSVGVFAQIKVRDLVTIFQDHKRVQEIHLLLSQLLLEKGTLSKEELINFFEQQSFQEYIEDENLDKDFFHYA